MTRAFGEGLFLILRSQLFLPHMDMIISSKSTVDLARKVFWILSVPFVQHCFIRLLLSLYHCMIVTDCFVDVSPSFHVSPINSIKDDTLKKLTWYKSQLVPDQPTTAAADSAFSSS